MSSAGDWYRTKQEIEAEFNYHRIDRTLYEHQTKFAIGMIYKCGNADDKKAAERMAKSHGYKIDDLLKLVN